MTTINLSGQNLERQDIAPKLQKLKTLMNQRKVIWDKLDQKKKRKWVNSDKDPVMSLAWDVYQYLNNYFRDTEDGIN